MLPILVGAAALLGGGYWWKHRNDTPKGSVQQTPSGFSIASNQSYSATFRTKSLSGQQVLAGLKAMNFTVMGLDPIPGDPTGYSVTFSSPASMALMNTNVYRWENV